MKEQSTKKNWLRHKTVYFQDEKTFDDLAMMLLKKKTTFNAWIREKIEHDLEKWRKKNEQD